MKESLEHLRQGCHTYSPRARSDLQSWVIWSTDFATSLVVTGGLPVVAAKHLGKSCSAGALLEQAQHCQVPMMLDFFLQYCQGSIVSALVQVIVCYCKNKSQCWVSSPQLLKLQHQSLSPGTSHGAAWAPVLQHSPTWLTST